LPYNLLQTFWFEIRGWCEFSHPTSNARDLIKASTATSSRWIRRGCKNRGGVNSEGENEKRAVVGV